MMSAEGAAEGTASLGQLGLMMMPALDPNIMMALMMTSSNNTLDTPMPPVPQPVLDLTAPAAALEPANQSLAHAEEASPAHPLYVNAKQYARIVKRRVQRSQLEARLQATFALSSADHMVRMLSCHYIVASRPSQVIHGG